MWAASLSSVILCLYGFATFLSEEEKIYKTMYSRVCNDEESLFNSHYKNAFTYLSIEQFLAMKLYLANPRK